LGSEPRAAPAWRGLLEEGASALLGRELSELEVERFGKYLDLLQRWQRVHRLVGSVDPRWMVTHLVLDSLAFLRALPEGVSELVDIGSGAGIPGVPIKIVSAGVRVTLIEARERRVSFLRTVVRELGLPDVLVVGRRAEEVVGYVGARYDAAVMRCAGSAVDLLPVADALVRPGGTIVVGAAEEAEVPPGAERLVVNVPGLGPRWLLRRRAPQRSP
jgi:16S rRNA (guanine527-N7)-methyltransferase